MRYLKAMFLMLLVVALAGCSTAPETVAEPPTRMGPGASTMIRWGDQDYYASEQHLGELPQGDNWRSVGTIGDSVPMEARPAEELQSNRPDLDGLELWASDSHRGFLFVKQEERYWRFQTEIHRNAWIFHDGALYLGEAGYTAWVGKPPVTDKALPQEAEALGKAVLEQFAIPQKELYTNTAAAAVDCTVYTLGDVLYVCRDGEVRDLYFRVPQETLEALFPGYFGEK